MCICYIDKNYKWPSNHPVHNRLSENIIRRLYNLFLNGFAGVAYKRKLLLLNVLSHAVALKLLVGLRSERRRTELASCRLQRLSKFLMKNLNEKPLSGPFC